MQGGVAGVFSYDLNRCFETIPAAQHDEFQLPALVAGAYDVVIAWDHQLEKTWLISQGFPETETSARHKRANERADFFLEKLNAGKNKPAQDSFAQTIAARTPLASLAPSYSVGESSLEHLRSDFSEAEYIKAVQRCIDYIRAGDVFQINLSQRLLHPATTDSLSLYLQLRSCNPATFSGYFDISAISKSNSQIISASPERFVSVRNGVVETRPIKGTRPRTGIPLVDLRERERLLASEKDNAENTMIVDLMRNDLSRVCCDDSIHVTQLCELEAYESVLHLVSAIKGRLKPESNLCDLIRAVFPGGSIAGAPKIRAMEIIAELEPTARGAYCGSLGYLGFDGSADLNILIRTVTANGGWWQIPVGGGVVAQSDPANEYEETWTKAVSMLKAIQTI
ncbi:UNVERIFIED_CONTAM: hypothetical protein GTU68_027353 [Idotea baltica]|nr:hypothetical protein [Idotea baltica]